jgi:hypothetical protein
MTTKKPTGWKRESKRHTEAYYKGRINKIKNKEVKKWAKNELCQVEDRIKQAIRAGDREIKKFNEIDKLTTEYRAMIPPGYEFEVSIFDGLEFTYYKKLPELERHRNRYSDVLITVTSSKQGVLVNVNSESRAKGWNTWFIGDIFKGSLRTKDEEQKQAFVIKVFEYILNHDPINEDIKDLGWTSYTYRDKDRYPQ